MCISCLRHWSQAQSSRVQSPPCSWRSLACGWAVEPAAGGGCSPGSSLPSPLPLRDRDPQCGAAGGESCTLHLLPLPPFLLGNRELIRPATHLAFLVPAEEEPANPKLLMLELRLSAGTCLWWLRCRAGQAVPACRGAEMPTLLAATQLRCPPRDRTRGSHESLLV